MPEIVNLSQAPVAGTAAAPTLGSNGQPVEMSEEIQDFSDALSALLGPAAEGIDEVSKSKITAPGRQILAGRMLESGNGLFPDADRPVDVSVAPAFTAIPDTRLGTSAPPMTPGKRIELVRSPVSPQPQNRLPEPSTVEKALPQDIVSELFERNGTDERNVKNLYENSPDPTPKDRLAALETKGLNMVGAATVRAEPEARSVEPELRVALREPVGTPRWAQEISSRVTVFAKDGVQAARMELNPPSMGPMDVRVNVVDDTAEVSFVVQHASTRDLLESAVSRLREDMLQNGFGRVDVNISQGGTGEQSADGRGFSDLDEAGETSNTELSVASGPGYSTGLIDVFA